MAADAESFRTHQPAAQSGMPTRLHLMSAPLPVFPLQPFLGVIVRVIAKRRPSLFSRIGTHADKVFMIDPVNMPFALLLRPNAKNPSLKAVRRSKNHRFDARIAGSFLTLFDMVDGRLDGDSLFFTRDLIVEGDTEAVVCLRNALDDLEGSIADDIAALFGSPGRFALSSLRRIRSRSHV